MTPNLPQRAPVAWLLCAFVAGCSASQTTAEPGLQARQQVTKTFAFKPGSASYKTISRSLSDQEIEGQSQHTETLLSYYLTLHVDSGASGLLATFVVDSVLEAEGQHLSTASDRDLVGVILTAALNPTGELSDMVGHESDSPIVGQIINQIREFFPRVPADGAAPGKTWVDTVETTTTNNGAEVAIQAITHRRAGDWAQHAGAQALPVHWTRSYSLKGTGEQLGQPYTLDGQGEARGTSFLSANGRYLGSVVEDNRDLEVLLTGIGLTIPVRQVRTDTVRILP